MKYKVCVYAICKNEEKFVERWMDSMKEADEIIVTDTGSTDNTVNKLKELGAVVFSENIQPWRFDKARNISLSHVPADADICVCTDLDEIFNKGWRFELEKIWTKNAKFIEYIYNWSLKQDGTPTVSFYYTKIHKRKGIVWKYSVHEWPVYVGKEHLEVIRTNNIILNHYPDSTKSRSSYIKLLELGVKEDPNDSRMHYYLGREYMFCNRYQNCIDTLKKYLELPSSKWNQERASAMRIIAKAYIHLNNSKEAYCWHYRSISETPDSRDCYFEFAYTAYYLKEWAMTLFLTEEALKINNSSKTFANSEQAWDETVT